MASPEWREATLDGLVGGVRQREVTLDGVAATAVGLAANEATLDGQTIKRSL